MSLEAQDSPTTRTTCRIVILLFIVISVQANVHAVKAIQGNERDCCRQWKHVLSSIWTPSIPNTYFILLVIHAKLNG